MSMAIAKGQLAQPVQSRLFCCQILGKTATKFEPFVWVFLCLSTLYTMTEIVITFLKIVVKNWRKSVLDNVASVEASDSRHYNRANIGVNCMLILVLRTTKVGPVAMSENLQSNKMLVVRRSRSVDWSPDGRGFNRAGATSAIPFTSLCQCLLEETTKCCWSLLSGVYPHSAAVLGHFLIVTPTHLRTSYNLFCLEGGCLGSWKRMVVSLSSL